MSLLLYLNCIWWMVDVILTDCNLLPSRRQGPEPLWVDALHLMSCVSYKFCTSQMWNIWWQELRGVKVQKWYMQYVPLTIVFPICKVTEDQGKITNRGNVSKTSLSHIISLWEAAAGSPTDWPPSASHMAYGLLDGFSGPVAVPLGIRAHASQGGLEI